MGNLSETLSGRQDERLISALETAAFLLTMAQHAAPHEGARLRCNALAILWLSVPARDDIALDPRTAA